LGFLIPQVGDRKLFEVTLEPTAAAIQKLGTEKDVGESEIKAFRGKKVKVAVGLPYFESFASRFGEEEDLPHEIRHLMAEFDFHFASLSCSFQPDNHCRLVWARFGVNLSATSKKGEPLDDKPIAYDMFPEEVLSETGYQRKMNFSFGLKFNLGLMKSDLSLKNETSRKELIVYEPEIFASGICRSNAAWDFRSTEEKGIWGNKRDLLLIIQAPKNSNIKGRFLLGAEVECNFGKLVRIPLAKKEDEAVEVEYALST
jgi:hypothetical protein